VILGQIDAVVMKKIKAIGFYTLRFASTSPIATGPAQTNTESFPVIEQVLQFKEIDTPLINSPLTTVDFQWLK